MKDLYVIVEGETEYAFVNKLLIPYWFQCGLHTNIQAILLKMKGGGHGFNNIEHFKNTIKPILYYKNEPIITTLIDHYGINSEQKLPNYKLCATETDIEKRLLCLENQLFEIVQMIKPYHFFIPNIIKHEMETLMFADPERGFELEDEKIRLEITKIANQFECVEDINHTPQGAPSKRLCKIYEHFGKKYRKINDCVDVLELTSMDIILAKCPRFNVWVKKIIDIVNVV